MVLYVLTISYLMAVLGCYIAMDSLKVRHYWGLCWVWPILLGFAIIYMVERSEVKANDKQ